VDRYSAMHIGCFLGVYKNMTKEEILSLARECGARRGLRLQSLQHDLEFREEELIAFANAVRAAALEEAAGIVDEFKHPLVCLTIDGRMRLAAAIREAKS